MGARNIDWTPSAAFDSTAITGRVALQTRSGGRLRAGRFGLIAKTGSTEITVRLYEDNAGRVFLAEWIQDISGMTANDPPTDFADHDFGGDAGPQFRALYVTVDTDAGSAEAEFVVETDKFSVEVPATITTAQPS